MGQFSWLDCKDESQIIDNIIDDVYVLVPRDFGGGHIKETYYEGYGDFGGRDIYELVAEWNRSIIPEVISEIKNGNWKCHTIEGDVQDLYNFYYYRKTVHEKRDIGIILACYDEDNIRLKYPIKITHDKNARYEACGYSKSDPNQGWPVVDDEEDDIDEGYAI